jgi:hypothetical protein
LIILRFYLDYRAIQLNPAKTQLISGFIDTYLNLTATETQAFQVEIGTFGETQQEEVMQIVTSWMREGIQQGQVSLVLRLLQRKFGELNPKIEKQIQELNSPQLEALGEALLDFASVDDLRLWLSNRL